MENMDKGLTVPKWVLIVWPKTPQMPQNLSDQFVCSSPKVLDFNEKRLHWASVVRGPWHCLISLLETFGNTLVLPVLPMVTSLHARCPRNVRIFFNLAFFLALFSLLPGDIADACQSGSRIRKANMGQSFLHTNEVNLDKARLPFQIFGI